MNLINDYDKEIKAVPRLSEQQDTLSAAEMQNLRSKILLSLKSKTILAAPKLSFVERYEKVIRYIVAMLMGFSVVGGTAFASNNSKPGDLLYPLKIAKEQVELSVATNDQVKANLQAQFASERIKELKLIESQKFHQNLPNASSTDANENNSQTELEDKAKINAQVQVSGAIQALQDVKNKLQAAGNSQAAAVIDQNILNLQTQAQGQNLDVHFKIQFKGKGKEGQGDNNNDSENNNNNPGDLHSKGIKFDFATSTFISASSVSPSGSAQIKIQSNIKFHSESSIVENQVSHQEFISGSSTSDNGGNHKDNQGDDDGGGNVLPPFPPFHHIVFPTSTFPNQD